MSFSQSPREILMVRPCNFMFNQETAVTNHYQVHSIVLTSLQKYSCPYSGWKYKQFRQWVETEGRGGVWLRPGDPEGELSQGDHVSGERLYNICILMVLFISDHRTCHTTWGQTPCSQTTGSLSTTLGRSSSTPWPRQIGERRPLIDYLWWMTASHWSGGWSGDKTSFSGWRTTLRITRSLTWCNMRRRGSSWREQDPLCLTIKVIKLYYTVQNCHVLESFNDFQEK